MEYKKNNLLLNRVFSKSTLISLLNSKHGSNAFYAVIQRYVDNTEDKTNRQLISEIYQKLKTNYRNEYYYKNTLLNKLLFKKHSPYKTTALTEIPVSKSKADFILINGKAVVYEIKTELDNFDRLDSQLENYYKAFDHVCIVTSEINLESLIKRIDNNNIGIYKITKRGALSVVREPIQDRSHLEHETIFKILRKYEYENILLEYYKQLPNVSQFQYYKECKRLFANIEINTAYEKFRLELKKRCKINIDYVSSIPDEIKSVVYFSSLKDGEFENLNIFLDKKYGG
ncbi:MAG: hypothetical protein BHW55_06425 [Candidatus Melainabacteria bacterium 35_41]|nr:MAG: hypothetical protein BHW55_06425 [Candidatus Melainabacteria bacterium 35_41]